MTSKQKYNFPVMLLGNEKFSKEPEQIIMNSYDINVDDDEEVSSLQIPRNFQRIIDDYSENSSIDNSSLCEMNCIPCYSSDDKSSQSYTQKLQYYTTVGKDECPRIFDINHYSSFNEQFNNFSPRRQKSFSSNSISSNTTQPDLLAITTQRISLNNNINTDNNESYFSDASIETNATLNATPNESNYYIKTLTSDYEDFTRTINPKDISSLKNGSHSHKSIKRFHFLKQTIPTIPSQEEVRYNDSNDLGMTPIKSESSENTNLVKEITNSIKNLKFYFNSSKDQTKLIKYNIEDEDRMKDSKEPKEKEKKKEEKEEEKEKEEKKEKEIKEKEIKEKEIEIEKDKKIINNKFTSTTKVTKSKPKKHRSSVSKYDFIKVLVYLSGEHYYVLSRFLISRMLTATQVDYYHAVRIALDLKKKLVDDNILELSQKELEKNLFNIMKHYGYNEKNIELYRLLSAFYRERIPMIILISGPRCVGKSTLATKLAERLNLPNIVKTDYVYDLMCSIFNIPEEDREPIWYRNCLTNELLEKYENDCKLVKKGLEADIKKAFTEGKSIIIEGTHVNHILYDFVLDCITKFSNQETKKDNKSVKSKIVNNDNNNLYSSKLLTTNDNPCNAIIVPFYLDMDNKECHREFLYNQMIEENLIYNQNTNKAEDFMLKNLPFNIDLNNDELREFESKIDIIGNIFRKENTKRQCEKTSFDESKSFKYINVDANSFLHTLDLMHNEVLNKIQEKFSISE